MFVERSQFGVEAAVVVGLPTAGTSVGVVVLVVDEEGRLAVLAVLRGLDRLRVIGRRLEDTG